ncbi:MAG: response regulator transcription factor [Clostridiales bacterium]|nr:response regulator transcription factor [Clostridiales bacterium]
MTKLLVVDDEENIRAIIRKYAEFSGYEVTEAGDGMEAVSVCRGNMFDLIIMDIMMPELDGFSACREIRKFSDTPILMLSARGEEYDKINAFNLGIDDYVVKPFSPKELMLRVEAILKRAGRSSQRREEKKNDTFIQEGLTVDFTARIVAVDGKTVDLSPKEYDLLFYLIRNKRIALSRERLIEEIWGYDFDGDDRTLDTHIKLLRRSLGPYSKFITTLRGVGYRFEAEN